MHAVGALVEQHGGMVVHRAGTEQHVPTVLLPPDLRVAHVAGAVGGIAVVAQDQLAVRERAAVLGDNEGLVGETALVVIVVLAGLQDVAGVVAPHRAVTHDGRARVRAVGVELHLGDDGAAVELPGREVAARPVAPPMARPGPAGSVLMEDVVLTVELAEAVRVGEPADSRLQMEGEPPVVLAVVEVYVHLHNALLSVRGESVGKARGSHGPTSRGAPRRARAPASRGWRRACARTGWRRRCRSGRSPWRPRR